MNAIKYKVGDCLITRTAIVFRIIDVFDDGKSRLYDIKSTQSLKNSFNDEKTVQLIKCLSGEELEKQGRIVKEEDINEFMSVLFDKSST
jgi:hypothetical protein